MHIGAGWPLDAEPVYHGHAGWRGAIRLWEQAATMLFAAEEVDMGVRLDARNDGWDAAPGDLATALGRLTPTTEKPSTTAA